ncbi:molybdopterin converting factor subunit 1 [Bacillus mangrovi]|uniref:Molybdopterin synthase sulfur carrier subunit n=1 Tax=Metabacillus mangrovi TaxID=1491830 RepID=A0A7X2S1X9_9BACI|nr:molybdopterin converting factor subunit 1 [Metabacillus mangrovi]MTH51922.1 molybdopterin converting factor subunit 1 [Metabacillus mangrovi]
MIKVLLFAAVREFIGKDMIEMEGGSQTVLQLREQLEKDYPEAPFSHAMAAVNESFVPDDYEIKPGDTVAFIPPVSGG